MKKILVVDDNPAIQDLLTDALSYDYRVATADGGEEAIAYLSEYEVDAVVLDIEMQRTDGWETLRVIRDPENGWDTKVIMLTCMSSPENFLKSVVIGADYFVTKPFDMGQLLTVIRDSLADTETAARPPPL